MSLRNGRAPSGAKIRFYTALAALPWFGSAACSGTVGGGQSFEYAADSVGSRAPAAGPGAAHGSQVETTETAHPVRSSSGALGEPGIELAVPASAGVHVDAGAPSDSSEALYVDPVLGSDDNDGASDSPFRTLKKALSVAEAGMTVWLRDGTYGVKSGETWSKKVPDGVSVRAVTPGNAVLAGQFPFTGLDFVGAGTASGLALQGFRHAVSAWSGPVSIEESTVDTGGGFDFSGSARVTVTGVTMSHLTSDGLHARGSAEVVVADASFGGTGSAEHCEGTPAVIAEQSARVHFTGVSVSDFAAGAIDVRGAAEVDLTQCLITRTGQTECDGAQIEVSGTADVSLYDTTLRDGGGTGISVADSARLGMEGVFIGVHTSAGVRALGGTLTVANSDIRPGSTGVFLSFDSPSARCSIDGTLIEGNAIGVELEKSAVAKIRRSTIGGGDFGVYAPSASPAFVDLGVPLDPGENTLSGKQAALTLFGAYGYARTFGAAGNNWNPGVQGADAEGKYPSKLLTGALDGKNFHVAQSSVSIQL